MAINRISGNILQDNLVRGDNLAVQGNLIYFDVQNNRVGILNSTPTTDFDVVGNVRSGNVTIYYSGNVDAGNVYINNLSDPVANSDAATKYYVDFEAGAVGNRLGNISIDDTTIYPTYSPANITLQPTSNSEVFIDTTSGLVLPVGDTSQRPASPVVGTVRFNTDDVRLEVYDGTEWDSVVSGVTGQIITPDGVANTFTLDRDSTSAATLVAVNGVVQLPTVAYTVTGNSITFAEVPLSTDIIDVRFL
jgi:hypothetical protein